MQRPADSPSSWRDLLGNVPLDGYPVIGPAKAAVRSLNRSGLTVTGRLQSYLERAVTRENLGGIVLKIVTADRFSKKLEKQIEFIAVKLPQFGQPHPGSRNKPALRAQNAQSFFISCRRKLLLLCGAVNDSAEPSPPPLRACAPQP